MKILRQKFGFTLIEILIAVGILAGAIASMMPMVNVSAMLSVADEKLLQAVTLANNKMVDIEKEVANDIKRGKFPDEAYERGLFDPPFNDYTWEYTIKKVEIPMPGGEGGGEDGEGTNAIFANVIKIIQKEMSKAVREIKLSVSWEDPKNEDKTEVFTITTHLVNVK